MTPIIRQHNRISRDRRQDTHLTEVRIRARSRTLNERIDPTLLALATTLPMSCFPVENVPPSGRYGTLGDCSSAVRSNVHQSKKPRRVRGTDDRCLFLKPNSSRQTMPDTAAEMFKMNNISHITKIDAPMGDDRTYPPGNTLVECRLNDESVPSTTSQSFTSTTSSNWMPLRSSIESAGDVGMTRSLDTLLSTSIDDQSLQSEVYPRMSYTSGCFTNGFGSVSDDEVELGWDDFSPYGLGFVSSLETLAPLQIQLPAPVPTTTCPIDLPDEKFDRIMTPFEERSSTSSTSPLVNPSAQQATPALSNDRSSSNQSSNEVKKEVDNFLDELSNIINWDGVDCANADPEQFSTDITNSQNANSVIGAPIPDHHNSQPHDRDLSSTKPLEETLWWNQLSSEIENSASSFEQLHEEHGEFVSAELINVCDSDGLEELSTYVSYEQNE